MSMLICDFTVANLILLMQQSGKPAVCDRNFFSKVTRKTNDVNDAAL